MSGQDRPHGFSVDTHLLRELGDLLVGRDSTAVLELIKNGYDADATVVTIDAEHLADAERAVITVSDNGTGMTLERFVAAFLRIAGRDKEVDDIRSNLYGRAYTGQKGIGRLASQKLADKLSVRSVPAHGSPGVIAHLDWEEIDHQTDLTSLQAGLEVAPLVGTAVGFAQGTRLEMRRLKGEWHDSAVAAFVNELQSVQAPPLLRGVTAQQLRISAAPLIEQLHVRDVNGDDPGFEIRFAGQLETGEDLWARAASEFQWLVELAVDKGRAVYQITPTARYAENEPVASTYHFEHQVSDNLHFQARIYTLARASASRGPLQGMVRRNSGVRFYLEGFRVLPYGEFGDDWLGIDRDYRSGPRYYTIDLDEEHSDIIPFDEAEGLAVTGNAGYFGAVFVTRAGVPGLRSLVNREGFVPGPSLDAITDLVRTAVRLSVRVRRSVSNLRNAGSKSRNPPTPDPVPPSSPSVPGVPAPSVLPPPNEESPRGYATLTPQYVSEAVRNRISTAQRLLNDQDGSGAVPPTPDVVDRLAEGFRSASTALTELESIQPDLRVLAGVGLQLGAFVHDINGMLSTVRTIRDLVQARLEGARSADERRALTPVRTAAEELAHVLARQSSYLTDVLSTDPRRRRSRLRVSDRLQSVLGFLAPRLEQQHITIDVDAVEHLRTPPMFPAEFSVVLTNLLTNAVKNAGQNGHIRISGSQLDDDGLALTISNTGHAVDLTESERWFLPFESTTVEVDDVLGQGLGLGLPIVRAIAADYNGSAHFVSPAAGFSTAVQVVVEER